MKKIITKTIFTISILCCLTAAAQYTNASLNGPWLTHTDTDAYLLFDGNGNINEFGVFNGVTGSNVGTYSVATNGAITGNFSIWSMPFTGQMLAVDTGNLVITGIGTIPLYQVKSPGALTDTLKGKLVDDSTSTTKNVVFAINSAGQITYASGLTGVSGRIFTENGIFAGYIKSTDNTMGSCWKNMMISGTYSSNSLTGKLKQDCNGHGGTVSLTRSGKATIAGIFTSLKNTGFTMYPNPFNSNIELKGEFTEKVTIRMIDIYGNVIISRVLNSSKTINDLGELSSGIYILELFTEGVTSSYKLIKE